MKKLFSDPVSYISPTSILQSINSHPIVVISVLIIFLYLTLSASIAVLLEALTFVKKLTLVQGYRQVSGSVQCSQITTIPYIPIDNTYRMDIFIIFYLKICYNVIPLPDFLSPFPQSPPTPFFFIGRPNNIH
jgi:hypothetical protein